MRIFVRSLNFFRERSMIYFVRHGKIVFLAIFSLAVFSAVSTLLAVPSNCQNCSYVCGYLSTGVNSKGGDSVCVLTGSVTVSDDVWGMIDFQDGVKITGGQQSATSVTFGLSFPLRFGNLEIGDLSTLDLGADLKIGNGYRVKPDVNATTACYLSSSGGKLIMLGDWNFGQDEIKLTVSNDFSIDMRWNTMNFVDEAGFKISSGVNLTIENAYIRKLRTSNFEFSDNSSSLTFKNCKILVGDGSSDGNFFELSKGKIFIEGFVEFYGAYRKLRIAPSDPVASASELPALIVKANSTLLFSDQFVVEYDWSGCSSCTNFTVQAEKMLRFGASSSKIIFSGSVFRVPVTSDTGVPGFKGGVIFEIAGNSVTTSNLIFENRVVFDSSGLPDDFGVTASTPFPGIKVDVTTVGVEFAAGARLETHGAIYIAD